MTIEYPAFLGRWFTSGPGGVSGWGDGVAVASSDELAQVMDTLAPGDAVVIRWMSGATGAASSATVTLTAGPADRAGPDPAQRTGPGIPATVSAVLL